MKKIIILFASLLIACELIHAQDIIVKNDGSVIKAYRTDYSGQLIYYQTSDSDTSSIFRIKKEDVLVIRLSNGTAISPNAAPSTQDKGQSEKNEGTSSGKKRFPDIDLTDYHGFLLSKGNCVYVTYNTKTDYETAAVEAMKKTIAENGLWQVVDKPSQAHFVLQYNVCLVSRDFARLLFRPRDNYEQIPYLDIGGWNMPDSKSQYYLCGGEYASEDVDDNINIAQSLITHVLQNYKTMLESDTFMEGVKTGKVVKTKGHKENWYVIDYLSNRYDAYNNPKHEILKFHKIFYR